MCDIVPFAQDQLQNGAIFQRQPHNGTKIVRGQDARLGTEQYERRQSRPRVVIHDQFPGDGAEKTRNRPGGKLICLPESLQELMEIAEAKFGKAVRRVLTVDGAEVDDIAVLRDGDHLVLCW